MVTMSRMRFVGVLDSRKMEVKLVMGLVGLVEVLREWRSFSSG